MPGAGIAFRQVDGEQAAADLGELRALYTEVYAEPPYERGSTPTCSPSGSKSSAARKASP
jgi:hypothetical protein